ncbi:MAG: hypothetical protein K0Q72_3430 [Armatimonadetes bacterium]|jgi:hypothetical protein|nr:hypothetical protein [Armatimonadota bacterium]
MKRCILCKYEKDLVSMVQVAPAGWNGFQNYVDICADCQASETYQKMIKQKKIILPKK